MTQHRTSTPASPSAASIPIGVTLWRRCASAFGAFMLVFVGVSFLAIVVWMTVVTSFTDNARSSPASFSLVMLVVAAAGITCLYIAIFTIREVLLGRGELTVSDGRLILTMRTFFREPLVVPIEAVWLTAISRDGPKWHGAFGLGVFPIVNDFAWDQPNESHRTERLGWLCTCHGFANAIPHISKQPEWPNIAVLFDEPVELRVDTREGLFAKRVRFVRAAAGICLRSSDLEKAEAVLAASGTLRTITETDARHVDRLLAQIAPGMAVTPQSVADLRQPPPQRYDSVGAQVAPPVETTQVEAPRVATPPIDAPSKGAPLNDAPSDDYSDRVAAAELRSALNSRITPVMRSRVLTIGFYAVGLLVSGALVGAGLAPIILGHGPNALLFLTAYGALLMFQLIPKRLPPAQNGVTVDLSTHAELGLVVREVADRMNCPMPATVSIVFGYTARCGRGDSGGIDLGLGIGLVATHTVDELKGVIAHEFAHRDDLRASELTVRALMSMVRWAYRSQHSKWLSSLVTMPLRVYLDWWEGRMNSLSRQAEFAADHVAALATDADTYRRVIRDAPSRDIADDVFWRDWYVPALRVGMRPPLARGLAEFVFHSEFGKDLLSMTDDLLGGEPRNARRTHPPTRERIAALEGICTGNERRHDTRSATALFVDLASVEEALVRRWMGAERFSQTSVVDWGTAADRISLQYWTATVERHRATLSELAWRSVPEFLTDVDAAAARLGIPAGLSPDPDGLPELSPSVAPQLAHVHFAVGRALACAMLERRWQLEPTSPGNRRYLRYGDRRVAPAEMIERVANGECSPEEWAAFCDSIGLGTYMVTPAAAAGAPDTGANRATA